MTEPREDDETNNPHPGPHDEGGHGGMATREHDAHEGRRRRTAPRGLTAAGVSAGATTAAARSAAGGVHGRGLRRRAVALPARSTSASTSARPGTAAHLLSAGRRQKASTRSL